LKPIEDPKNIEKKGDIYHVGTASENVPAGSAGFVTNISTLERAQASLHTSSPYHHRPAPGPITRAIAKVDPFAVDNNDDIPTSLGPASIAASIPPDMMCSLCRKPYSNAVVIDCCFASFDDECIRQALLTDAHSACPRCHAAPQSAESLRPNKNLQKRVDDWIALHGARATLTQQQQLPTSVAPTAAAPQHSVQQSPPLSLAPLVVPQSPPVPTSEPLLAPGMSPTATTPSISFGNVEPSTQSDNTNDGPSLHHDGDTTSGQQSAPPLSPSSAAAAAGSGLPPPPPPPMMDQADDQDGASGGGLSWGAPRASPPAHNMNNGPSYHQGPPHQYNGPPHHGGGGRMPPHHYQQQWQQQQPPYYDDYSDYIQCNRCGGEGHTEVDCLLNVGPPPHHMGGPPRMRYPPPYGGPFMNGPPPHMRGMPPYPPPGGPRRPPWQYNNDPYQGGPHDGPPLDWAPRGGRPPMPGRDGRGLPPNPNAAAGMAGGAPTRRDRSPDHEVARERWRAAEDRRAPQQQGGAPRSAHDVARARETIARGGTSSNGQPGPQPSRRSSRSRSPQRASSSSSSTRRRSSSPSKPNGSTYVIDT
jgi:hypothetical protein